MRSLLEFVEEWTTYSICRFLCVYFFFLCVHEKFDVRFPTVIIA